MNCFENSETFHYRFVDKKFVDMEEAVLTTRRSGLGLGLGLRQGGLVWREVLVKKQMLVWTGKEVFTNCYISRI